MSRHGVVLLSACMLFAASAWAANGAAMPPSGNAQHQAPAPETTGRFFGFDIPAQPLSAALNHYASITERAALFRSEVVAGRTSSAVRGRYTPEAALAMLLEGTGLVAERTRTGPVEAFALKVIEQSAPSTPAAWASAGDYPGLVQARLWQALCSGGVRTAPGRYRALLRFRVDAVGGVQRVQLLGSTGDAGRDTAMLEALGHVRMDAPPPTGMPQPMTMLILPSERDGPDAASGSACAARNGAVS
ncbi:TonB family protein [Variovorax sp. KBW07]|uniref:TonB family protein n=1 Tax=Variovorax sp. KBW07 TaxID=2153358 RepID=UPI0011CF095D|nr:TonB family protein [Variovorax sp. KBW07]